MHTLFRIADYHIHWTKDCRKWLSEDNIRTLTRFLSFIYGHSKEEFTLGETVSLYSALLR
jgi:hypothetical protein